MIPSSLKTFVLLLLSIAAVRQTWALEAYITYTDSACIDQTTIEGTYTLSYDDADYSDMGFSIDYQGLCMYFDGGSLDLDAVGANADPSDYIMYGYCVDCNGVAGCYSSYNQTCDNTTVYDAEEVQNNGYESTRKSVPSSSYSSASSSESIQSDPLMRFSQAMMETVNNSQMSQQSLGQYYVFGGLICVATLFGFVAVAEKRRQRRQRRLTTLVELSKNLHSASDAIVSI